MKEQDVIRVIGDYLKGPGFTARKITDTPTDDFMVVNRRYVTLNGNTASRPPSPTLGQFFFDTSLGFPIWWNGSIWVKSDGTAA